MLLLRERQRVTANPRAWVPRKTGSAREPAANRPHRGSPVSRLPRRMPCGAGSTVVERNLEPPPPDQTPSAPRSPLSWALDLRSSLDRGHDAVNGLGDRHRVVLGAIAEPERNRPGLLVFTTGDEHEWDLFL